MTQPIVHLDNAATSWPKPDAVPAAMQEWMQTLGVDPHRGGSDRHRIVSQRIEALRNRLGQLVGMPANHVVLGSGATAACNLFLKGFLKPGMRVWTSDLEHNAVARPLMGLARREGIQVERIPGEADGLWKVERLEERRCQGSPPDLLAINHASNVTGQVQDLAPVLDWARSHGITTFVDAAQSAGRIDLSGLDADAFAIPGHKGLMGPPGVGALCLREDLPLGPLMEGGTGSTRASDDMPSELPLAHEAGTPNSPGLLGWLEGIEWVLDQGPEKLLQDELDLLDQLRCELRSLEDAGRLRILAAAIGDPRVPVLSLVMPHLDPAELSLILDQEGFATRAGYHCAPWIHERLGTLEGGTLRVSPGPFNSEEEIVRLAALLRSLA